jgi:transposase
VQYVPSLNERVQEFRYRARIFNAVTPRGGLWQKMYHFFQFNRAEFMAHYYRRSNIESTINMIKTKFRDHVRSKTDTAMKNEVLCKVLCHNICCMIHAMCELEISPDFSAIIVRPEQQKPPFPNHV